MSLRMTEGRGFAAGRVMSLEVRELRGRPPAPFTLHSSLFRACLLRSVPAMSVSSEERSHREADRVRLHTNPEVNEKIDRETEQTITRTALAGPGAIQMRLDQLDREWDIERKLEANASTLGFIGVLLAALVSPWWLILPGIVTFFLFQHAVQGWCPPLTIFRRMGTRTRKEIDREKFALKALRGDFSSLDGNAKRAMEAATT